MTITLNPGSGPVPGADEPTARANMQALATDLLEHKVYLTSVNRADELDDGQGRYGYRCGTGDGRTLEIRMPGIPVDQVRYTGADGQDIWDFPRLYVDGSSWIWKFALRACEPPEGYVNPHRIELTPYEQAAEDEANDSAPERCGDPDCDC